MRSAPALMGTLPTSVRTQSWIPGSGCVRVRVRVQVRVRVSVRVRVRVRVRVAKLNAQ